MTRYASGNRQPWIALSMEASIPSERTEAAATITFAWAVGTTDIRQPSWRDGANLRGDHQRPGSPGEGRFISIGPRPNQRLFAAPTSNKPSSATFFGGVVFDLRSTPPGSPRLALAPTTPSGNSQVIEPRSISRPLCFDAVDTPSSTGWRFPETRPGWHSGNLQVAAR